MPFTQADLTAIDRALAKGEQTIQFQDRTVTYRSVKELLEARALISSELSTVSRQVIGVANKGL
jgi:hypothetical protein